VPADNPFVGQAGIAPEIWAYGLRNPFRFSIDSEREVPIIADVGEVTWEAVYLGVKGADYGYPCVEGSMPFRTCNPAPPAGSVTSPIFEYGHESQTPPVSGNSITGGPVYYETAFPIEYQGQYFFGDYVDAWIRRGRIDTNGQLVDVELFAINAFGIVDLVVSPAGCLTWVSVNGSGVRDICYSGGANGQPQAISSAIPMSGLPSLAVQFTGSGSTDPDSDTLAFSWDFDDTNSSTMADPNHSFPNPGVYDVVLSVDDQQGAANSSDEAPPLRVVVGNRSPSPSIDSPAPGTYSAGSLVSFSGSATDPEEGVLGASQLSWSVVFHHGTHTHPFLGPIEGIGSGSFLVPNTGESATDVFYRIYLSATDSGSPVGAEAALTATGSVDLHPSLAQITLAALPAGPAFQLALDQQASLAPFGSTSVVGFLRSLDAISPQTFGDVTYAFDSWSDGGAQQHVVPTPATMTTFTATYRCSLQQLHDATLASTELFDNCDRFSAGPSWVVDAGGDVTVRARQSVSLMPGVSIALGGTLKIEIVP
jgi:hypothetical protein